MSSSNEFCLLSCDPQLTFTWPSPDLDLDQSLTKTFGRDILSPEPRSESGSEGFVKYSHPPPPKCHCLVLTEQASSFGIPSKKNVWLNFSTFSDSEVSIPIWVQEILTIMKSRVSGLTFRAHLPIWYSKHKKCLTKFLDLFWLRSGHVLVLGKDMSEVWGVVGFLRNCSICHFLEGNFGNFSLFQI